MSNQITCGDCLDFMKSIPDKTIDIVVTSPPYNLNKKASGGGNSKRGYSNWYPDDMPEDKYRVAKLMPAKRPDTIVSNANCAKALVLNMLSAGPGALSVISQNFETMPVGHLLSPEVTAAHLNDDRLGRFLDEFHEAGGSHIANQYFLTGLLPCLRLGNLLELHADLTSFHVHGAYEKPSSHGYEHMTVADSVIHITHGYSRDHHPELKQFGLSMVVEANANIPVQIKPVDGNAADGAELMDMARRLQKEIQPCF